MKTVNSSSLESTSGVSTLKTSIFEQLEFLEQNRENPVDILEKKLEWFKEYLVSKRVVSKSAMRYINIEMVIEDYLDMKGFRG